MAPHPIREGFHTVTPYLFQYQSARLIQYLCDAFNAEVMGRKDGPDGVVMHAELRIGNSMLMVGEASEEFGPNPTSIYLYVPDCDAVYGKALAAGGISVFQVTTMPSGERYGGVKDPFGNIWWMATHVEDLSEEEQDRRWKDFKR